MSDTVIQVENLSKKYIIGHQQQERYTTLRDAIANRAKSLTRKIQTPPFGKNISNTAHEEFWALKDVSFEIKQGARVGIIGRNGAGKSTLLKILSRITEPTNGRISIKGRVASLLEVGTGFHPELTGRENIYLNGAVLGMSKAEIGKKFDEIVVFAEVEKFLDTPVKRYSSGMYVRLAFAIAAHLEPEILILDEVLAVGDAQFQKKCLGKMGEVAQEGRTVLFVSHNMAAIRNLCHGAPLMKSGQLIMNSAVEAAISEYLTEDNETDSLVIWQKAPPQCPGIRFTKAYALDNKDNYASLIDCNQEISVVLEYKVLESLPCLRIGLLLKNVVGVIMCGYNDPDVSFNNVTVPGDYISKCTFPAYTFNSGRYLVCFGADVAPYNMELLIQTPYCLSFTVEDTYGHGIKKEKLPGVIRPKLNWISRQAFDST